MNLATFVKPFVRPTVPQKTTRILIADDDEGNRDIVATYVRTLAEAGVDLKICMAATGTEALRLLEIKQFQVVITDYCMPGCLGSEVAKTAREKNPECRIIMMSGNFPPHATEMATRYGIPTLGKPFTVAEFIKALAVLPPRPRKPVAA